MFIVHVRVHVKPEAVESFKAASLENAHHSRQESGVTQFDVLQQQDDPTQFVLVEGYRDVAATVAHKATAHYAQWRDAVAEMMAEPRLSTKYSVAGTP
jgi:quinol monooxygenase YgiN